MKTKAQEEIVGFVLIIIIMAIIGIVFIFFMIKSPAKYPESTEIESFIQASSLFTSSCELQERAEPYNMQELAEACYKEDLCNNGKTACEVFNETMIALIENSFNIASDSKYKGYKMSYYVENTSVLSYKKGINTGNILGADTIFKIDTGEDAKIVVEMFV